jgi:hypothetical protein
MSIERDALRWGAPIESRLRVRAAGLDRPVKHPGSTDMRSCPERYLDLDARRYVRLLHPLVILDEAP